jgi:hypothetical protein
VGRTTLSLAALTTAFQRADPTTAPVSAKPIPSRMRFTAMVMAFPSYPKGPPASPSGT